MSFISILEALFIGPLKLLFEIIFLYANRVIGHPGLAIICLSLIMNILVLPLYKRADAMQEATRDIENKLHDGVAHIKKTFSGDERMMMLQTYYRQNNYKPTQALNGSVSLLLEIPFFMAAYQFLSKLELLHGVSLGPIADLGAPDGLLVIGGLAINVLPVIMTLVNVISSAIYLKGFPLKTKIQLYGMALFFLVFLYTSPSGLVFYWTLNNVFSLVKTIFYKLKNPKKVLSILMFAAGLGILVYGLYFYQTASSSRKLLVTAAGAVLMIPLPWYILKSWLKLPAITVKAQPNRIRFLLGGVVLTVLTGLLIPSAFISASPQEYVNPNYFYHPIWFVVSAACLAVGTFLIWMSVFYWLATPKGKVLFERAVWVMCGVMLMNYMFFGTKLGTLSPTLQYLNGFWFVRRQELINLAIVVAVALVLYLLACKAKSLVTVLLLTAVIALSGMSAVNIVTIFKSIDQIQISENTQQDAPHFELSTEGQNVVVIMLDRAMGEYIPYILAEKPGLKTQFDGFTYYANTISFGGHTNFAMPALIGGYEYTPVEMNRRSDEPLVVKHNEALKVMPVAFLESGFDVTVFDPSYANYQWIPDLSIFDDYPQISSYVTHGKFNDAKTQQNIIRRNTRNFFVFSVMKSMPLIIQEPIYNCALHNLLYGGIQIQDDVSTARGYPDAYLDAYQVLLNLPDLTRISFSEANTFMYMINNTTHSSTMLQAPEYELAETVDNRAYAEAHKDRFTVDGKTLTTVSGGQMAHYHTNIAALLRLGEWLDYLRANDVYDNTRIILVSDHGQGTEQMKDLMVKSESGATYDMEYFYPLLMVKDFNATGFTTSEEFMTNADVPALAMNGVLENPVNPFTGKPINSDEKYAHDQYVTLDHRFEVEKNNGNTFLASQWASVKDDLRVQENWTVLEETVVLDEHQFP